MFVGRQLYEVIFVERLSTQTACCPLSCGQICCLPRAKIREGWGLVGTRGAVLHPFATVGEGWTKLEILLTFMTSSTSLKGKCRSDRFSCPAMFGWFPPILRCMTRATARARVDQSMSLCCHWKMCDMESLAMKDFFPWDGDLTFQRGMKREMLQLVVYRWFMV